MSYFYLITTGRKSGLPREIEIWYVTLEDRYYLISEKRENANWVKNIRSNARIFFRVAKRKCPGYARILDDAQEPGLCSKVRALFDAKYGWSDGLIVEIKPKSK